MRKCPEEPAKEFSVGTIREGIDHKDWIVILMSNNQKRWQQVKPLVKKRSVKRIQPKRSVKRSVKRTVKRSVKRSVKKSDNIENEILKVSSSFNEKHFSPMLAKNYLPTEDPTGYYLSEKLDGARAIYYNGKFITRNKKTFNAPEWFYRDFPKDIVLDGELYTKRNDFNGVISIIRKKVPVDREWERVTFMVFDLPMVKLPFAERYRLLSRLIPNGNRIKTVEHTVVSNLEDLLEKHQELTSLGAEGSMLNTPDAYYSMSRSSDLLKLKDFKDDEVVVQDFKFGEGRNAKVMGSLVVKWLRPGQGDHLFDVGTGFTDDQRFNYKKLFPKGTVIKIKFFEVTKMGVPRFPVFLSVIPKSLVNI